VPVKNLMWILEQVFSVAEIVNKKFAMVASVWGATWVTEVTVGNDFRGLRGQKCLQKYVSDFEWFHSYDLLKLRIKDEDY